MFLVVIHWQGGGEGEGREGGRERKTERRRERGRVRREKERLHLKFLYAFLLFACDGDQLSVLLVRLLYSPGMPR